MRPRLSVIIPTWNNKELLTACLDSLRAQTFQQFEAIVVDDGSTDGTKQALARRHPWATVVDLSENKGFCVAANAGVRRASAPLILLLNNDVTLEPSCLARLVEAAGRSAAALFSPLILWRDESERVYGAGDRQRANGRPESIGHGRDRADFTPPQAIFGVSACAGLYRRKVFDKVGLFDERFVAYFEDSDLSFRARLAGFTAELVPDALAYHVGSASIATRTWWRTRQCYRNHALLVLKNMPRRLLLRHAAAILAERWHQTRRLFSAARNEFGALRATVMLLTAWLSVIGCLPHVWKQRRRIQRSSALKPAELEKLLTKKGGDG